MVLLIQTGVWLFSIFVATINIWESVSFELWIFLQLLPNLRWGVSIFYNHPNGWGKLTQCVGKLGILGKNLGVKASPRYIRIHGITGRVLTRLTCNTTSCLFAWPSFLATSSYMYSQTWKRISMDVISGLMKKSWRQLRSGSIERTLTFSFLGWWHLNTIGLSASH